MKSQQLSMFTNGEDLPLFSGTAPRGSIEPFAPKTEHRQESLAKCRVCLDTGTTSDGPCTCEAGQKARSKPKRKGPPPFMVHLTWQNGGPKMHQSEPSEELAAATMRHWFNQFAGIKSIMIEDVEQGLKHVFTPAGYLFTVPAI